MLVTDLFIISKLSPQVLIRVWHQKAFKEEGMGVAALVWPQAAVKACLEVMHTKSWCSSCYLWIAWSHLESESQERYFSSSVGRGYIHTSNIFLNMNIFPLNHCGLTVITSICLTSFFFFFLILNHHQWPVAIVSKHIRNFKFYRNLCLCV